MTFIPKVVIYVTQYEIELKDDDERITDKNYKSKIQHNYRKRNFTFSINKGVPPDYQYQLTYHFHQQDQENQNKEIEIYCKSAFVFNSTNRFIVTEEFQ